MQLHLLGPGLRRPHRRHVVGLELEGQPGAPVGGPEGRPLAVVVARAASRAAAGRSAPAPAGPGCRERRRSAGCRGSRAHPEAERVAGRVEEDADVVLRLELGERSRRRRPPPRRAAARSSTSTSRCSCMRGSPGPAGHTGGTWSSSSWKESPAPPPSGRSAHPVRLVGAERPAEQPLVEARQPRRVGGVQDGGGQGEAGIRPPVRTAGRRSPRGRRAATPPPAPAGAAPASWCAYGVRDRREVAAEQHLARSAASRGRSARVEGHQPLGEVGGEHRGVQVHPLVPLGEVEELAVLGHAQVRDHQLQPRVPLEQPGDRLGPGVLAGQRPGAAVDDDRGAGLLQPRPDRVEQAGRAGRSSRPARAP